MDRKYENFRAKAVKTRFCKDRPWLGTITKRFSDFAENIHISVFWAETTENEVRNLKKNFVARCGGKFDFLFLKKGNNYYSIKKDQFSFLRRPFDQKLNEDSENYHIFEF